MKSVVPDFGKWIVRALLFVPGLFLIFAASTRLPAGFAVERAFPVPDYLQLNADLPRDTYRHAYDVLAHADQRDGDIGVLRAEAGWLAGTPAVEIIPVLDTALRHAPANARGWTLLAELLSPQDPARAAGSLAVALQLSPSNYWLAAPQAQTGMRLWPQLSEQAKSLLARQAHILWSGEDLRPEIRPLLENPAGIELMSRAFTMDPEGTRALNRWLAADRRRTAAGAPKI